MRLFTEYAPVVERIARTNRSMGSYRRSEDDVRNVMAQVFERLRRDDYRALRLFIGWQNKNPRKLFDDWLTIVTVNIVRNYVSSQLGVRSDDGASLKQLVGALSDAPVDDLELSVRPHITTKETAQRILEFARASLVSDQFRVLAMWLEGASFDDIASELHLPDAKATERLLRAALARLRRRFGDEAG